MKEVQERVADKGVTVELTPKAREWLAKQGYDAAFGARPLKRALQKYVESPLSKQLLAGDFKSGDHVLVDVDDKGENTVLKAGKPSGVKKKQEVDA